MLSSRGGGVRKGSGEAPAVTQPDKVPWNILNSMSSFPVGLCLERK